MRDTIYARFEGIAKPLFYSDDLYACRGCTIGTWPTTASTGYITDWRLLTQVTETDIRLSPYNRNASAASRGWYFAKSATDLAVSEIVFSLLGITFHFAVPTRWVVVKGTAQDLAPQAYLFDWAQADESLSDQEALRQQLAADFPQMNDVYRLYEDEVDLTPAQQAATPFAHLTEARMLSKLNEGQHLLSLSGHGWGGGCGYGTNAADNAANGCHTYIAYADSCSTNEFDVEDAVSERSLYNPTGGAVAYVGNTRFSWIGVGDNFQRAFFHRLTSTRHLGLLADLRCTMVSAATGAWTRYNKWAIFAQNLMGDPEMPVWVSPPRTMTANFTRELDHRVPWVVRVSTRLLFGVELPVAGAIVTLSQGSFYRQGTTDLTGQVAFDLSAAQLGKLEVTITKLGFLPSSSTPPKSWGRSGSKAW